MELEGKTILISGVGPGLGGACAAAALRDGATRVDDHVADERTGSPTAKQHVEIGPIVDHHQ